MTSPDPSRVTSTFLQRKAANPGSLLQSIRSNLQGVGTFTDMLQGHLESLQRFWNLGERRRQQRAGSVRLDVKLVRNGLAGKAFGTETYSFSLPLSPPFKYTCTCPDFQKNSRRLGPCKHLLAASSSWIHNTIVPELTKLEGQLQSALDRSEY